MGSKGPGRSYLDLDFLGPYANGTWFGCLALPVESGHQRNGSCPNHRCTSSRYRIVPCRL